MIISSTLGRYLAGSYLKNLVYMLLILLGVIYLFDTVELLRRASKHDEVPLRIVLQMGLYKLPEMGEIIAPFAILFSAIFTFWQLSRRSELVILRGSGFSVWQFMGPILIVGLLTGILQIGIINPAGSLFVARFKDMESDYLSHRSSHIAIFEEGLWMRQSHDQGHVIIHAANVKMPEWSLKDVMTLYFDSQDNLIKRLDAPRAKLENDRWTFYNATINTRGEEETHQQKLSLQTNVTIDEIEKSFASPGTMSFWKLPRFIKTMETTGFDATRLKIHYQNLIAQPFLYLAMILLAASVSIRPQRMNGTLTMIVSGILIGFIVFFLSSFLQALGASHQIPIILAAWSPPLITLMLGVTAILHLEDG